MKKSILILIWGITVLSFLFQSSNEKSGKNKEIKE
jgi:hypothetical protein